MESSCLYFEQKFHFLSFVRCIISLKDSFLQLKLKSLFRLRRRIKIETLYDKRDDYFNSSLPIHQQHQRMGLTFCNQYVILCLALNIVISGQSSAADAKTRLSKAMLLLG
jgi:hypothetical protein